MNGVKSIEDMASDFITGTCQLIPKSFAPSSDHMHDLGTSQDPLKSLYGIVCGSQAEFYIRPLNTCISDLDQLLCKTDELAFSDDYPTLPSDISGLDDTITCYEIESYPGILGFVRLRVLGEMNYNWKHKEYIFNRNIEPDIYTRTCSSKALNFYVDKLYRLLGKHNFPVVICGPAIKYVTKGSYSGGDIGLDQVFCVFCPQWPRDAKNWPLRPRNNGWPTSDTISEVVRNGCHVVYAQHRACRDDELQWRLSFSVAEVILLHSWTKTQQIVYHLLRFFAKRELIKDDCPKEDEVLCTYHLKTLMLWTCEKMPPEWWDSSPVIAICCELLNILSEWLKRRHFPNYFIPEANLFHHPSIFTMIHQTERRVNDFRNYGILCRWFVENYILPITRTELQFLSTRIVTSGVSPDFMDYMLPLLEHRKWSIPISVEIMIVLKFKSSSKFYHPAIKTKISSVRLLLKMQQIELNFPFLPQKQTICLATTQTVSCFKYYDLLLHNLQLADYLSSGEISCNCSLFVEFVNAMSLKPKIIRSQYHNFPKTYRTESSRYQFMRAQGLMENLTGLGSRSEFQLVYLMSKELLRRTLEADCSESNGITRAALVYLAALHVASSEYEESIRLCSAVLVEQTPREEKETLNAGCLLFIDDVARIVGLCVLHKKITDINLHYIGRCLYLDLRLSPEVFAHHLTVLSSERRSTHLDLGRDLNDSSFSIDNNILALLTPKITAKLKLGTLLIDPRQIVYRRIDILTETEVTATNPSIVKETVIDLLIEIALENMISFYSVILKDFGIQCNTVDCYRALYLYKRLQYDEVLYLCDIIVNEPDLHCRWKELSLANVLVIPPSHNFFAGDVQSLLGFHTLVYYLSPFIDDLHKSNTTNQSTFENWFVNDVKFEKKTLDCCLQQSYSVRDHYLLGRHFLARYLKVRCCIDLSLPYEKAMTELSAHKANLPFELIIGRSLLRRIIIKNLRVTKE